MTATIREVLEPEATIDGQAVVVDGPLSELDPNPVALWWGANGLRARKVGLVELLYSPPGMLQIANREPRQIVLSIPRYPEGIEIQSGHQARIQLSRDGELSIDNPDPAALGISGAGGVAGAWVRARDRPER